MPIVPAGGNKFVVIIGEIAPHESVGHDQIETEKGFVLRKYLQAISLSFADGQHLFIPQGPVIRSPSWRYSPNP